MGTNVGYASSVYRPIERRGLETSSRLPIVKGLLLQAAGLAAMMGIADAIAKFFS